MTNLLFVGVLAAMFSPTPVDRERIEGSPPLILVAKVEKDQLELSGQYKIIECVPVQAEIVDPVTGKNITVTKFIQVEKIVVKRTSHEFKEVKGFEPSGKPIDEKKLAERLKSPTVAVVAFNGEPIAEPYRKLLKDDVLILMLPKGEKLPVPPPPCDDK